MKALADLGFISEISLAGRFVLGSLLSGLSLSLSLTLGLGFGLGSLGLIVGIQELENTIMSRLRTMTTLLTVFPLGALIISFELRAREGYSACASRIPITLI